MALLPQLPQLEGRDLTVYLGRASPVSPSPLQPAVGEKAAGPRAGEGCESRTSGLGRAHVMDTLTPPAPPCSGSRVHGSASLSLARPATARCSASPPQPPQPPPCSGSASGSRPLCKQRHPCSPQGCACCRGTAAPRHLPRGGPATSTCSVVGSRVRPR